jgi:formylglycine-generating enzyme required for sulfatase activity
MKANGYRLPTEAEWEYFALTSKAEMPSPLDTFGLFRDKSRGQPGQVRDGRLAYGGLYDVWGNVWEWCWDDPENTHPDAAGPLKGPKRLLRGGGWNDPPSTDPDKLRRVVRADFRSTDIGFRVVRSGSLSK